MGGLPFIGRASVSVALGVCHGGVVHEVGAGRADVPVKAVRRCTGL